MINADLFGIDCLFDYFEYVGIVGPSLSWDSPLSTYRIPLYEIMKLVS
jgi:predicted alpha/beta superfamily hydrolase